MWPQQKPSAAQHDSRPASALHYIDKITGIAGIIGVLCFIFVYAHHALYDPDIWYHLKTGEYIIRHHAIPSQDIFSFTRESAPWPSHRWLFEVLVYFMYSIRQAEGLIFLTAAVTVISFFVLFLITYTRTKSFSRSSSLVLITAIASGTRFNIRPEIFSLLFFALFLYVLSCRQDKKLLWMLIPIQVVWVNMHLYFFLGPLLVALFALDSFVREQALSAGTRRLTVLFTAACFACFLNQGGVPGAFYSVVVFMQQLNGEFAIFRDSISELLPVSFRVIGTSWYAYIFLLSAAGALLLLNIKRVKPIDALLFSLFLVFGLVARNVSFFSFIACSTIASYLPRPGPSQSLSSQRLAARRVLPSVVNSLILIVVVIGIVLFMRERYYDFDAREFKSFRTSWIESDLPKKGADFLLTHNLPGALMNDFDSGSYLLYRLFPSYKVFIDGRTEVYGSEFVKTYFQAVEGNAAVFERLVDTYGINTVFLTVRMNYIPKILAYLYKSGNWKMVFLDENAVIFIRNTRENLSIINAGVFDPRGYVVPACDVDFLRSSKAYPSAYLKRASIFKAIGEYDLSAAEYEQALRIMPNCPAAQNNP